MIYTGIGARNTPPSICESMTYMARFMAKFGATLRSGGAPGADQAFELGCDSGGGTKEIYLPYQGFCGNQSPLFGSTKEARLLAAHYHPNWSNVGDTGRDYLARDGYQVLGLDLKTPTKFIICYTDDGKIKGGTAQALRIAADPAWNIPVFNMGSMSQDEIDYEITALLDL